MANLSALPPAWQPAADRPTLYYAPFSQPSRTVLQLFYEGAVEPKLVTIDLRKGEHKTPAFKDVINKDQLVPVIYDEELKRFMPESSDILRHLSARYSSLSNFYASLTDDKKAKVDEVLKFSGDTVRPICTGVTRTIALSRDAAETAKLKAKIPEMQDQLEARLKTEGRYFAGTEKPSIADIQILHEVNGPVDLGVLTFDSDGKHPLLKAWYRDMKARPASVKAYGNFGWIMWGVRKVLGTKAFFGSRTGTL
jgi:glutathione S-transferase